ncbi:hypothetical protein BCR32DRAFT_326455 [Anaeromyces robustus]|uniref:Uncharacterized protein n=1 Tax=Anaeromyces robustus TaxID=1754192 RepID=A0A1Y1XC19_9FUNG|nr:hypothetical protein BCR32DRAFT_326455 [Anaeromyces robustus]|eukprot:ORX83263.1 hypothetical protein BCR32DRAFT_326455 [Anaeromyces robustus]
MTKIIKLFGLLLLYTTLSKANRCGKGYGSCPDNACCSQWGWCGFTSDHCGAGCNKEYGRCDNVETNVDANEETNEEANKETNLEDVIINNPINGKNIVNHGNSNSSNDSTSGSGLESICKNSKLSKSIIVYYPEWKYYDFPPKDIPFSKLTHINYAFAEINPDDFSLEYDSNKFLELIDTAHKKNKSIKVLMSIGGWTGSRYFSKMASSSSNRTKFVKSVKRMIDASNADGIDIDWEYPGSSGAYDDNYDSENDTNNLLKLLKELRETIGTSKLITAAVPFNTFEVDHKPLSDMTEFAKLFDFINIMAYDFSGSWSSVTAHQSALYSTHEDDSGYSLSGAVKNWMNANFPAKKIVVGIPAYGRSWIAGSSTNHGYLQRPSNSYPKGDEEDYIDSDSKRYSSTWKYKNIRKQVLKSDYSKSTGSWERIWDSKSSAPFLFNKDTKQFITYDDPKSVGLKADYVIENNLGGMMMWEIEEDSKDSELISSMYQKFISLTCSGAKGMVGSIDFNLDGISNDSSSPSKTTTIRRTTTTSKRISTITTSSKKSTSTSCPNSPAYKCCSSCIVYFEDNYKWGTMNGEWCSLTYDCLNKINQCWAEAYGYSCCSKCVKVIDTSYNKKWGLENGKWCGLPSYC